MKRLPWIILSLLLSVLFVQPEAFAFPNMIRHGYTTCVTCHFNASGGGSLRSYGKFVAGETLGVLNTSENALPWIVAPKEEEIYSVSFLGRTVQAMFDTPQLKRADFIKMQADLEGSVEYKTWVAQVTVGPRLDSALVPEQKKTDFFLRRYYVGKQDMNYSVKVGKFFPEYGLNVPNHNVPTRKGLFFNHNQEPLIAQASYFTTSFGYNLAYLKGSDLTQLQDMKGYSGTLDYKMESMRLGISRISMKQSDSDRESSSTSLFGTMGYLGLGYTMMEVGRKELTNPLGRETKLNVGYLESGYEVYKGFIPYFFWEYSNNVTTKSLVHSPGLGVQLGPITHVEIIAQISKLFATTGDGYSVFSMFNVYF